MPEGPTIVILSEECQRFVGRKVLRVEGNTKLIDVGRMKGKTVVEIRTWGKHVLVCFKGFTLRVHLMLFGSYRVNERKETPPRIGLGFSKGEELNFYACSIKYLEGPLDEVYDWSGDVLSPAWDPAAARRKLKAHPDMLVCDALLDQSIFAGVGNIIKNEVLFRIRLHPMSRIGFVPARKLTQMIAEGRKYSFDFLAWRREYVLKKHLLVHNKGMCPRCHIPLQRKHLGRFNRRTFYCGNCQVIYDGSK